jgi:hypothetical protein
MPPSTPSNGKSFLPEPGRPARLQRPAAIILRPKSCIDICRQTEDMYFSVSGNPLNPGYKSIGGDGVFIIHHSYPEAIIEVDCSENISPYVFLYPDGTKQYLKLEVKFINNELTRLMKTTALENKKRRLCILAWCWYSEHLRYEERSIHAGEIIQKN